MKLSQYTKRVGVTYRTAFRWWQQRQIKGHQYKAKLVGIEVVIVQESYTSKASFLDRDLIPTYDPERREKPRFSGKREHRGLYRASNGRRIHADINGSYNILRKAFPDSFGQGTEAPAVVPRQLAV